MAPVRGIERSGMADQKSDPWRQGIWQKILKAFDQWQAQLSGDRGGEGGSAPPESLLAETAQHLAALFQAAMAPYLKIPPLGLGREAVLKSTAAAEAQQRFVAALAVFLQAFGRPLLDLLRDLPGILKDQAEEIENADDLYRTLSEVLSQNYQQFLSSPEGAAQLAQLIHLFLEFKQRLDASLAPALRFFGIPGKAEMDDVYSGLHRLKKRQRKLEGTLAEQQTHIAALNRQIETLAARPARARRPARKKPAAKVRSHGPGAAED
jgi:hypothetical protein